MFPADYKLAYAELVEVQRYHNYRAGLMEHWEIVAFYQDMLEVNCGHILMPYTLHFIEMGLVHVNGRGLH